MTGDVDGHGRHGHVLVAHPGAELYGSDRVLLETVGAFVGDGRRVTVTLPGPGPLVAELELRGARVVFCPSPVVRKAVLRPKGFLAFVRDGVRGLRAGARLVREGRPSLVFVNTITAPLWLWIARRRGIPSICHVHEGESTANRLVRRALAAPVLLATEVITNSSFSRGVLASAFRRLSSATVVLNAVPGPALPRPSRATLEGGLRVVYVGRLSPRKGVDVAIAALSTLAERGILAHLDLFGDIFPGYEWYSASLREQVHAAGLEDRVVFHGFVDDVWEGIASGDVLVVPSTADEPFGNTAVEGVLAGRPVIASATSGLLEATAGYASARTVPAADPAALAAALADLAEDWTARRAAADADAAVARDRHSTRTYGRAILDTADRAERSR